MSLVRPDNSKVNAVNDEWDKFSSLKSMIILQKIGLMNVKEF